MAKQISLQYDFFMKQKVALQKTTAAPHSALEFHSSI